MATQPGVPQPTSVRFGWLALINCWVVAICCAYKQRLCHILWHAHRATHTEELPDEAGAGGGQGNDGQGRGGEDDDDDPATVEAQAAKEKTA